MLVVGDSTGPVPREQMMNVPVSKNVIAAFKMTLFIGSRPDASNYEGVNDAIVTEAMPRSHQNRVVTRICL